MSSPISTEGLVLVAVGAIVLILLFTPPRHEPEQTQLFSEFAVNSRQLGGPTCSYVRVTYDPKSDEPWYEQPVTKLTVDIGCLHRTWPSAAWEVVE